MDLSHRMYVIHTQGSVHVRMGLVVLAVMNARMATITIISAKFVLVHLLPLLKSVTKMMVNAYAVNWLPALLALNAKLDILISQAAKNVSALVLEA